MTLQGAPREVTLLHKKFDTQKCPDFLKNRIWETFCFFRGFD